MDNTYWHRQTADQQLFSDIHWSSPQQRSRAGKLAIIGGNVHGFKSVALSYTNAEKSGAGTIRTLLPDSLAKTLRRVWPDSEFGPSTRSGGFASRALSEWLSISACADWVILAGDFGHNSETDILIEQFLTKQPIPITLVGDAIDLMLSSPLTILNNDHLIIAPDFAQLQRLLIAIRFPTAAKSSMTFNQLIELLHSLTLSYHLSLAYIHENQVMVVNSGSVSSTLADGPTDLTAAATAASVWRMQQSGKPFEAMTAGIYQLLF